MMNISFIKEFKTTSGFYLIFYLNNIHNAEAWFNIPTDNKRLDKGSTLNMGIIAEIDRIIRLDETSSFIFT